MRKATKPLLLEIGCEEIPARFLTRAQKDFAEQLVAALRDAQLLPNCSGGAPAADTGDASAVGAQGLAPLRTFSTPRRLVAYIPAVLERQPDIAEEVLGPPAKVAFDAAGKPTRAAERFASKNQVKVQDLIPATTPKGEYLAVRKTNRGRPAIELLGKILPGIVTGLNFPKSMYWVAKAGPRFVRPIRWLLALLGEGKRARVVPFEVAGVKSAGFTHGHRRAGNEPIRVRGFEEYTKKLRKVLVEFDPEKRRERLRRDIKALLEGSGARLIEDRSLEDWVVSSTEWPTPIAGGFDPRFLNLPREILVTVMRDHQKYFAVEDQQGRLQPRFITVLNREADPKGLTRAGHERVLTARFRDAEFFWQADQRLTLRERIESGMLDRVIYHAKLGTYRDKVMRMQLISAEVIKFGTLPPGQVGHLSLAIQLSKCDLTTQMVQEFPELQGVVGGLYAKAQGEPAEVTDAIYEHYLPQGFEGQCPRTSVGAVMSFIDKFDTVLAGFAARLEPSGSGDPFALRRHAGGLIRLLLEVKLAINLRELVVGSYARLELGKRRPGSEVYEAFHNFIGDRLRYYLETACGLRYDTVRAVMKAGWDVPLDALERAQAVEAIRGSEDFVALSAAAKRIKNILAKSATADDWKPGEPQEVLLAEEYERNLYGAYQAVAGETPEGGNGSDYRRRLERIATLRPIVDRFFDKVLVMAEDRQVRENRLRLLGKLDELFSRIADLSEIESKALGDVDASTSKTDRPFGPRLSALRQHFLRGHEPIVDR